MVSSHLVCCITAMQPCVIGRVFQGVMQVERQLGGRLLAKPKQFQFQFGVGSSSLCLVIEQLNAGWRCKLPDNYQVRPVVLAHSCPF